MFISHSSHFHREVTRNSVLHNTQVWNVIFNTNTTDIIIQFSAIISRGHTTCSRICCNLQTRFVQPRLMLIITTIIFLFRKLDQRSGFKEIDNMIANIIANICNHIMQFFFYIMTTFSFYFISSLIVRRQVSMESSWSRVHELVQWLLASLAFRLINDKWCK